MGFAQDRVGLGLGSPGEQEHSNKMACCKQGPDGDGFEETHGWLLILRACLSLRFQGLTPTPQYQSSASSRLWPARPAALYLPNPYGLGSDSHGVKVFSGKLLKFLTQTGSKRE